MTTRREKILQKLNPKLLKMTPKLSGDEGSFIDLDCDDSLVDGAKNLMMRFFRNQDLCEKNKRNLVQGVTELTISSAKRNDNNEICEVISERLCLPFSANDEDDACDRPGRRLQKLKMELQEKMSAKWEEEYKKRVNENKVGYESKHKQQKYSDDDDDDDEGDGEDKDNSDDDGDCDDDSKSGKMSEAEDEGVGKDIDGENDDNEYEGDEEDELDGASVASDEETNEHNYKDNQDNRPEKDDEYDDNDACSLVPAYQPGGGMLYGGSELTQTDDGLPQNLLSPSLRLSMNELSGSKAPSEGIPEGTPKKLELSPNDDVNSSIVKSSSKLFSQAPNDSFDLNEAFEFCSGKFPDAEGQSQLVAENLVRENSQGSGDEDGATQDKFGSSLEEEEEEDDDENSEDGGDSEAEDLEKETSRSRRNIIAFEDSDGEEEEDQTEKETVLEEAEESQPAILKLLSDDEEGTEENEKIKKKMKNLHFSDEEDATNDCEEDKQNDSESSDGEEEDVGDECEERSVHYDSEENEIINPREFFEKEAELSGEEWSGDEDERGLDEFDVEEGDADKLDNDQVRSQLEKIHIRRVLDDDAREVRLIQEILFEDGDLHSDGKRRDRKFKWKNLGTFDEQGNEGEAKGEEGGNSSEDENAEEEELRKIRHEKELFLMTKKNKKDGDLSSDEEIVEDFHTIKVTSVKTTTKVPGRGENVTESTKVITDYTAIAKTTTFSNARGSFLTRNEEFLSRLAKATSGVTDNVLGPKSSKNFVFATKSPEKTNPERTTACKRQVEDSGTCGGRDKKIKLLPPRLDTGPSILDLLA